MNKTPSLATCIRGRRSNPSFLSPLLALLVAAAPAAAQTGASAETTDDEEVVTLSPFEVNAGDDQGYVASSSLAGSRLNASLLTTPASISVQTREFLDDIAATDVMEAAAYAMNAEPFYQSSPSDNFEANIFSNQAVAIRGFRGSTTSRNFFPWPVASDSYNVERFDYSRGPNSILFGTGAPGGVINTSTKRANFQDRSSLQLRWGSFESYRSVLDLNRELIKKKLAVRINLLWEQSEDWVNHGFTDRTGLHGALTFRPFKHTVLRLDAESLEQDRGIGRTFPLDDNFSAWTGVTVPTARANLPGGQDLSFISTNPYLIYDANSGQVMNWQRMARTSADQGSTSDSILGRTQNFNGPSDRNDVDVGNFSAFLEQRFFDKLFLELAYNYQNYTLDANRPLLSAAGPSYSVMIDPNAQLPDGTPNPNVGRHYTDGNWQKVFQGRDRDEVRLTASYELDLGPWLGRHQLAGLLGRSDSAFSNTTSREVDFNRTGDPSRPASDARNYLTRRHYLVYGDSARQTALTPIDSNGVRSGFLVWASNQTRHESTRHNYWQAALVSTFLKDRLTFVGGVRDDEFLDRNRPDRAQDDVGNWFVTGGWGPYDEGKGDKTYSYGAVARIFGDWVYLFANYSENFNIQGNNVPAIDADGGFTRIPIPPRTGVGRDIGVRFNLWEGRVRGSVAYYETDEKDNTYFWSGVVNTQTRTIVDLLEPGAWEANFQDTQDTEGNGWEFELTANPTTNWRVSFNAANKDNVGSNLGRFYKEMYATKRPEWLAQSGGELDPTGIVAGAITLIDNAVANVAEGRRPKRHRDNTVNFVTNYEFKEGMLRGYSVGGTFRWFSEPLLGYTDLNGDGAVDEVYGKDDYTADLILSRQFDLKWSKMRVQINVRNLFNNDQVQTVGLFPFESPEVTYKRPREVIVTTTFDF